MSTEQIKRIVLRKLYDLLYGENPEDKAEILEARPDSGDPLAFVRFRQHSGLPLSLSLASAHNRLLDMLTRIAAAYEVNEGLCKNRCIVVISKHGRACGAAVREVPDDATPEQVTRARADAIRAALDGDIDAAFGGEVGTNFEIDVAEAALFRSYKWSELETGLPRRPFDLVLAPDFTANGESYFERKKTRLFSNPALALIGMDSIYQGSSLFSIRGAMVRVSATAVHVPLISMDVGSELRIRGGTQRFTRTHRRSLALAWAIGSSGETNCIAVTKDDALVINAVKFESRRKAAEYISSQLKARLNLMHDLCAYSDGFFAFWDAPLLLADAGVTVCLAPHGSNYDEHVGQVVQNRMLFITTPWRTFSGHRG